jgi:hypothetical protein
MGKESFDFTDSREESPSSNIAEIVKKIQSLEADLQRLGRDVFVDPEIKTRLMNDIQKDISTLNAEKVSIQEKEGTPTTIEPVENAANDEEDPFSRAVAFEPKQRFGPK